MLRLAFLLLVPIPCACRLYHDRTVQEEYSIDLQRGKTPYSDGDRAENPLFSRVKADVFQKPTYAAFMKLLVRREA